MTNSSAIDQEGAGDRANRGDSWRSQRVKARGEAAAVKSPLSAVTRMCASQEPWGPRRGPGTIRKDSWQQCGLPGGGRHSQKRLRAQPRAGTEARGCQPQGRVQHPPGSVQGPGAPESPRHGAKETVWNVGKSQRARALLGCIS